MKRRLALLSGLILASAALILLALSSSSAAEKDCSPGPSKDLSACDFSMQDLTDANLSRSNLSHANLTGAILERANLEYTNLDGASLHNALLIDAVIQRASAIGADFSGSTMHYSYLALSNLTGANLTNVQADGVDAHSANFTDVDFGGSLLTQWMLEGSDLTNADLQGANLSDASLVGAELTGVKSGGVTISVDNGGNPTILPSGWAVKYGYLIGPGANLSYAELTGTNLTGSNLTGSNLSYSELGGSNLTGSNLTGSNLTGSNLTGSNLTGSNLTSVTIEGADLFDAVFDVEITSAQIIGQPTRLTLGWVLQNGQLLKIQQPNSVSIDLLGGAFKTGEEVWANFSYPEGSTYSVKWLRNGSPIESATSVMYRISGLDFDQAITFELTVSQPGYTTVKKTSTATVVQVGELAAIPQPMVNGEAKVGKIVSACFDIQCLQWDVEPTSIDYQWLSNGESIVGATSSTYEVSPQDLGKSLSVKVSASFLGYRGQTATSEQSPPASHGTLTESPQPQVTPIGVPKVGQTLTVNPGTWDSGVTLSYQWSRDGVAVTNATKTTYVLTPDDNTKQITVEVTGTKTGYATVKQTSTPVKIEAGAQTLTPTPIVTGTSKVGQTLTATPGNWDSGVTLTYQWLRDGVAISGATKSTLQLTADDNTKQISVEVTGTKTGYATVKQTSTPVKIEAGAQTLTPTPTVSGTSKVGQTLTVNPGTWDSGVTLSYQWSRDGLSITGATNSTLTLVANDFGKQISVEVTGTKTGYATVKQTSTPVKIEAGAQTLTPTPIVTGTSKVGQTLTATPGNWDSGVTLTYQWLRDGVAISGATKSTLQLTADDNTKQISVEVTGTKTGYATVKQTSTPVKIEAGAQTLTPTPTVSGTSKVGQTLTVNPGTWDSGVTLSYQWSRDGLSITGATNSTLTLVANDFGKQISVEVTGTKTGYATVKQTSTPVKVAPGTMLAVTPKITGTSKVGLTLKAATSSWVKSAKITYKWLANGVAIKGATSSSLKLTATLKGKKITVTVTQSASGYVTAIKTSSSVSVK